MSEGRSQMNGPVTTGAPAVGAAGVVKLSAVERAARARALVNDARQTATTVDERRARERARDAELVDQAKGGDSNAFQKLVVAHQGRLFSVAFGMLRDRDDAMDVVQDAFIKAHRKLAEFEGNAAFSTWLYRIAVNLCIDKKRSDARKKKTDIDDAANRNLDDDDPLYAESKYSPRLSGANPLRNAGDKQLGAQIGKAMAELSDDHRAVVLLREVEGLSYEEIAEALHIPKGTVMSRLFHARKNLQRALRPVLGIAEGMGPSGRPVEEGRPVREPKAPKAAAVGSPDPQSQSDIEDEADDQRSS